MKIQTLFALGLLVSVVGCTPSVDQANVPRPSQADLADAASETKLVSLKVDGMTCPTGCYPVVKSAIEKQKGVVGVELAPQKDKDAIDNPIVFVKYRGDLDLDSTFKAISRAGFEAESTSN